MPVVPMKSGGNVNVSIYHGPTNFANSQRLRESFAKGAKFDTSPSFMIGVDKVVGMIGNEEFNSENVIPLPCQCSPCACALSCVLASSTADVIILYVHLSEPVQQNPTMTCNVVEERVLPLVEYTMSLSWKLFLLNGDTRRMAHQAMVSILERIDLGRTIENLIKFSFAQGFSTDSHDFSFILTLSEEDVPMVASRTCPSSRSAPCCYVRGRDSHPHGSRYPILLITIGTSFHPSHVQILGRAIVHVILPRDGEEHTPLSPYVLQARVSFFSPLESPGLCLPTDPFPRV